MRNRTRIIILLGLLGLVLMSVILVSRLSDSEELTPTPQVQNGLPPLPEFCDTIGQRLVSYEPERGDTNPPPKDENLIWDDTGVYLKTSDGLIEFVLTDPVSGVLPQLAIHSAPNGQAYVIIFEENNRIKFDVYDLTTNTRIEFPVDLAEVDDFAEWSPNSKYLALYQNSKFEIWNWAEQKRFFEYDRSELLLYTLNWSPDSSAVAVLVTLPDTQLGLIMLGEEFEHVTNLPKVASLFSNVNLFWASDSQQVTFINMEASLFEALVVHRDGHTSFEFKYRPPQGNSTIYFAEDGIPLFWHMPGDGEPIFTNVEQEIILEGLSHPPFHSRDKQHMFIYTGEEGNFHIEFMRSDALDRQVMIESATDVGNPDWSPLGKRAAIVWAEGKGDERQTHLRWLDIDTGEIHDFSLTYDFIRNLVWSGDDEKLMFVARLAGGEERLEWLNMVTGEHRILNDQYADWKILKFDRDLGGFTAWGYDEGQQHYLGYTLDGDSLFDHPETVKIKAVLSPDQQQVALKSTTIDYQQRLELWDGQNRQVLADGLWGLGDPVWSADGQYLLHTQALMCEGGKIYFCGDVTTYQITRNDGEVIIEDKWPWGFRPIHLEACQ